MLFRPEINSNDFVFFFLEMLADLKSIFVVGRSFFFERFKLLVCSKCNHTQWPYMCMCCGLSVPRQFIPNVVVSVTIHNDMYICKCILKRDVCKKNMKPLWKVKGFFERTSWKVSDVQIVRYLWAFLVVKDKSNHPVAESVRSLPQESWS